MKKTSIFGICLLATGLLATDLAASEPPARNPQGLLAASYFFPSAANAQGAFGVTFKTRLVLTNPTASAISIIASLNTGTGSGGLQTIALAAEETRVYGNFLQDVFTFTGGGGFSLAESTDSKPFYAVGEVYADAGNGRFSTALVGMSADDRVVNLANLETGFSMSTGLVVDGSNRVNFGCANMDATAVAVRADVYNETSSDPVATATLNLLPNGWEQQSVAVSGRKVKILFWQLSSGGMNGSYCYGVKVNNQSGDGTSIPALYAPKTN